MPGLHCSLGIINGCCKPAPDLLERRSSDEMLLKQASDQHLGVLRGCQELLQDCDTGPGFEGRIRTRCRFRVNSGTFFFAREITRVKVGTLHVGPSPH